MRRAVLAFFVCVVMIAVSALDIAAAPPPGIQGNVTVVNPSSQPVPVTGADQPARDAITLTANCLVGNNFQCFADTDVIPAGNVMVIESFAATAEHLGPGLISVDMSFKTNGVSFSVPLGPFVARHPVPSQFYIYGPISARYYADGGNPIELSVIASSGDLYYLSISGYLVKCGAGPGCPAP